MKSTALPEQMSHDICSGDHELRSRVWMCLRAKTCVTLDTANNARSSAEPVASLMLCVRMYVRALVGTD